MSILFWRSNVASSAGSWAVPDRPQKITFVEMRDMGVRGLLIYCADYCCSHSLAISGDAWPDELRLSDLEPRSICVPVASVARMCGRISIGTR